MLLRVEHWRMTAWRQHVTAVSSREACAGVVAASTALVVSLLSPTVLDAVPLGLSPDAQYWFGYVPGFALLAGLVVGTAVWRRVVSLTSAPQRGALAGVATALGVVFLVPMLAGLYAALFPLLLSVLTGQNLQYALTLYPSSVWFAGGVVRTLAVSWSPLVGAVLVPLGAVGGWAYQRGLRHRGR